MGSNNLNMIPSVDQLLAYKKGTLNKQDSLWVEHSLEQNVMLKNVYENIDTIPIKDLEHLIRKINKKSPTYSEPVVASNKFWNIKTASAIIIVFLIITGAVILQVNLNSAAYAPVAKNNSNQDFQEIKNKPDKKDLMSRNSQEDETVKDSAVPQEITDKSDNAIPENKTIEAPILRNSKKKIKIQPTKVENTDVLENPTPIEVQIDSVFQLKPKITKVTKPKVEELPIRNKIVVTDIKVSKKMSVATDKDKRKKTSSPFLQSSPLKKSKSEFKADDLPTFKGGDESLLNYIKGSLGLTYVSTDDVYSDKLFLNFIVDRKGNIEDWDVFGHVAPEVSEKIREMMDEMPKWNRGKAFGKKGQASYSIIIAF